MQKSSKSKRYNLVIPEELFGDLQGIAARDKVSVIDVLRRFIKVGLYVLREVIAPNNPKGELRIAEAIASASSLQQAE